MIHDYFVKHSLDLEETEDKCRLSHLLGQWISGQIMSYKRLNQRLIFLGEFGLRIRLLKDCRYPSDYRSPIFQKDQAKNLNEEELVFNGSVPLRRISVSGSILILMGNTIHKFWGEYEVRNFNGGTLNVKGYQKH